MTLPEIDCFSRFLRNKTFFKTFFFGEFSIQRYNKRVFFFMMLVEGRVCIILVGLGKFFRGTRIWGCQKITRNVFQYYIKNLII